MNRFGTDTAMVFLVGTLVLFPIQQTLALICNESSQPLHWPCSTEATVVATIDVLFPPDCLINRRIPPIQQPIGR